MVEIKDADDFEKKFIEKYLKNEANKKIQEFEKKKAGLTDKHKILELDKKIKSVVDDLERNLIHLNEPERSIEKLGQGLKTDTIDNTNIESDFCYKNLKIPMKIWNYLYQYQKDGIKWMIDLYLNKKGGILADEMGLGKTLQVIGFVIGLLSYKKDARILILCPATIIYHWIDEFYKIQPSLEISKTEKGQINILSYDFFRANAFKIEYECVFLDEGHKIKNKDAKITLEVKKLVAIAKFILTGTPIQNDLSELWSVCDFTNPNLLGSYYTFQQEFEYNINRGRTEQEKTISYKYSVLLRSIIEPFILRRLKSQIQSQLPNKKDKVIFLSLSDMQKNLYKQALESKRFQRLKISLYESKQGILGAISYLRKICNHPCLVDYNSYDQFNKSNSREFKSSELQILNEDAVISKLLHNSSKIQMAFDLLSDWFMNGAKALIFFQTIQMLKVFEKTLLMYKENYKFLLMTGETPIKQRSFLVNEFNNNSGIFLFLLTTKVGGLGLNLTGASRIIIFDPDWNPSTDNQAKERIYRYGQKTDVEIYRFICKNTIEEKIYEKQIYKDCLSKKILSNPDIAFKKQYFSDLFSFYEDYQQDSKHENNKAVFSIQPDELVQVKDEDKRDFKILSNFTSKLKLNGEELIEYILRREANLDE